MLGEEDTSPVHQSAVIHTPKSKIGYSSPTRTACLEGWIGVPRYLE